MVPLVPMRDMRKMRGTYMEVTAKDAYTEENKMDYLQITLTDEEDVPGALQKLRTVYSNLMRLEYDNKRTRENREVQAVEAQEQKSELEEKLENLLENAEGVGKVKVMLMEDGGQGVYSAGETEVTGVLIVAEGADNAVTVQKIQQAVMALFQIDAHKIRIMKMK